MRDDHFYEPAQGHGLAHDPFNAIVAPRPIGWVGTVSRDGVTNLAPYSFFNALCYTPPIIGFSNSAGYKDSLTNAEQTREFTWNLVTRELAEAMNATSASVPRGTDEFALANIEKAPSRLVAPPRVAAARAAFECKVTEIIHLKNHTGGDTPAWLVLGEVVGVHIDKSLIVDGVFDTFAAEIVTRAGGPSAYSLLTPDSRFDMQRPK